MPPVRNSADGRSDERYRAPALDRGLDILEVLARQTEGMTRSEIVAELGVSASQIYRMLERLVARGYVTRLAGGDRYLLSMKLFLIGSNHPPVRRLIAATQPLMDAFARVHGQSLHLVAPERGVGVLLAQASPVSHWEFRGRVGAELDLFSTGSGLTLIATQKLEHRSATARSWGIADVEARIGALDIETRQMLETVRLNGYRVAPSRQVVGITDLSVPILGPQGSSIAVITCAYIEKPQAGNDGSWKHSLEALKKMARNLSHENGSKS